MDRYPQWDPPAHACQIDSVTARKVAEASGWAAGLVASPSERVNKLGHLEEAWGLR